MYRATGEIAETMFAPDGRIIVVEWDDVLNQSRVVTMDGNGVPLPGWPWSAGPTGDRVATAVLGPEGSVYVAVRGEAGVPVTWSWSLHRLAPNGTVMAGFPVTLPAVPYCELLAGPRETVYVACHEEDESTGSTTSTLTVVLPDGSVAPGWPVTLDGAATMAGFRPDGGIVAEIYPDSLTVLGLDGSTVDGWPRRIKTASWFDSNPVSVDSRGRVWVVSRRFAEDQCGDALATTYTLLRLDGTVVPGWPLTLRGWASDPALASDGSVTIVTDAGKAIRYSTRGRVLAGWPVSGVPVRAACYDGSQPVDAGPRGIVVTGLGRATRLTRTGRIASGWPATAPYRLATNCEGCTPGPGGPLPPAIGANGVFVGAYRGQRPRIVGIAWDGSLPGNWQVALGRKGDQIRWIRIAPDGTVWAVLSRWDDASEAELGLLVPVARDAAPQG